MTYNHGIPCILVVEDERIVAMGLQSQLEGLGYAVPFLASTGEEAVRLTKKLRPDLVLMDIQLDGADFDGVEAAVQIRRLAIPVVYLTAYSTNSILDRAKLTEPFGYILKPCDERELHIVIETALYKHRMECERRRLEELAQAQKMEAIGRLAGGVAHELNNALHVILGYSNMLLGSVPKDQPIYEALGEIKKQGDRATRLTEQLLALGRRQMLVPVLLNLNDLVRATEMALRHLLGDNIHLYTHLDPRLLPIKIDPNQIKEAIVNLAMNAKDAMPDGGDFTIQTANTGPDDEVFRTHPEAEGAYVVLAVKDNGQGMDEKTLKRCLEPFFTTKEFGKGIGLGLSTVDGIVHQSGGFITIASELGKGTTFTIYLPAVEQADQTQLVMVNDSVKQNGQGVGLAEPLFHPAPRITLPA